MEVVQGGSLACGESSVGGTSQEVPPRAEHDSFLRQCLWLTCALFGHHTWWLGLSVVGIPSYVGGSPHAPSKCVFQNTNLWPCYVFRDALEFLPCYGSNLNPVL